MALNAGQLQVSDNRFSGTAAGFQSIFNTLLPFPTGCTFPDGSTSASGTVAAAVVPGTSLNVGLSDRTANGTVLATVNGSLGLSASYNESGALSRLDGNWQVFNSGTVSISNGQIYAQDSRTSCSINGTATPADNGVHNLYAVSWTYGGCSAAYAGANGAVAQGAAVIDDSVNAAELIVGASVQVGDVTVVVHRTERIIVRYSPQALSLGAWLMFRKKRRSSAPQDHHHDHGGQQQA